MRSCRLRGRYGRTYIEAMVAEEGDPALDAFLGFIEADIKMHPEGLQALNGGLHDRLKALVGNADVNLDAPLSDKDE